MAAITNTKHEKFSQCLAEGMTNTAAWLVISPTSSVKNAEQSGSRLAKTVKVVARVAELRAPALKRVEVNAEAIARRAWEIAQQDSPDRVAALNLLAKQFPEFSEKHDIRAEVGVVLVRKTRGLNRG